MCCLARGKSCRLLFSRGDFVCLLRLRHCFLLLFLVRSFAVLDLVCVFVACFGRLFAVRSRDSSHEQPSLLAWGGHGGHGLKFPPRPSDEAPKFSHVQLANREGDDIVDRQLNRPCLRTVRTMAKDMISLFPKRGTPQKLFWIVVAGFTLGISNCIEVS